ncbi:lipoprotein LpqH [Mycobacterium sp. SMC-4]|uniref:lipoprotein LpqH n=1 Tax=Mycobacterium sp. SMC-4 TaxID=2857059 RepID=UPI0021B3EECA|nr:lipoprotein LpqH [Mycobacterium sp. SMC-4]UXA18780.1 lipoprotein LpqH [Mycobacterium sp. SMC-4]
MNTRLIPILAAATLAAGCGLTGTASTEPPAQSGHLRIDGRSQTTQSVLCTQNGWLLTIDARGNQGRAQAFVELGGERPVVTAVTMQGIEDHHGVADSTNGDAVATVTDGDVYTITGTVVGSDGTTPGQSRPMPFEIKAPC